MFRTELHLPPTDKPIRLHDTVLTTGSCFSECIGDRLTRHKNIVLSNPFGTVFNPLSLFRLLRRAVNNEFATESELVEHNELWSHYDFHSSFSGTNKSLVLEQINTRIQNVSNFLKGCKVIVLTFGTAYIYRREDTGHLVSNCHKHPAHWFRKELLTSGVILENFIKLTNLLPNIRFILTVSPVRHIRDTIPLNAVSKSVLRVACHLAINEVPGTEYFPAFEMMQDDLRDYRFYDKDMIHPSPVAEDYIWEKFIHHYFTEDDRAIMGTIAKIQRSLAHRPVNPGTNAHRKFLESLLAEMKELDARVDFGNEIRKIKEDLTLLT